MTIQLTKTICANGAQTFGANTIHETVQTNHFGNKPHIHCPIANTTIQLEKGEYTIISK